jgi:hypothetical protein
MLFLPQLVVAWLPRRSCPVLVIDQLVFAVMTLAGAAGDRRCQGTTHRRAGRSLAGGAGWRSC